MNLIGYITVDYLLIVYGNIVERVIVHVIFFRHASEHMVNEAQPSWLSVVENEGK